jgi:ABC-2 type transport system ATP-binding protein
LSSTPDALWSAPSLRLLRPAAVACTGLRRGRLLNGCSITVAAGMRLLVVGEPEESASMLVRVLAGLSRPSGGTVEIAGLSDPSGHGWGRRVAYLGPEPGIPPWMTPREALALAADLLELSSAEATRRTERVLSWVRLGPDWLDRPLRRGGPPMLQRTGLAAALLADPEVLLLDEPLRAVEAEERSRLLRLPGRRRTVVLASRYPASEDGIVSHVALIRRGRLAMLAPVDELAAEGLGVSTRGIVELADRREGRGRSTDPGQQPAVSPR